MWGGEGAGSGCPEFYVQLPRRGRTSVFLAFLRSPWGGGVNTSLRPMQPPPPPRGCGVGGDYTLPALTQAPQSTSSRQHASQTLQRQVDAFDVAFETLASQTHSLPLRGGGKGKNGPFGGATAPHLPSQREVENCIRLVEIPGEELFRHGLRAPTVATQSIGGGPGWPCLSQGIAPGVAVSSSSCGGGDPQEKCVVGVS